MSISCKVVYLSKRPLLWKKTGEFCSLTFQLSKKILRFNSIIYKSQLNIPYCFYTKARNKMKLSSIYDAEGKTRQESGKIKEEYGYQQWDMVASPGLKCTFTSPTFLSKLLLVFWKKHTKNIKDFGAHRLDIDNSHAK